MSGAQTPERFSFVSELDAECAIVSEIDWSVGVIRTVSKGFWSMRQITAHLAAHRSWVTRIHDSGLALALIFDGREAPPQSQEASELLRVALEKFYRPGDRCALIVPSSIAKLQLRRILQAEHHEFFVSATAAETWALAHKHHLISAHADGRHNARS